ncbi:MAG: right-handed parallel beta-helix repeat-containing protein [Cyanobacteria bacterium J06634_6]
MPTTVFADDYGFNAADATSALQKAFDDPNASRIVVRDMGTPWLVSQTVFLRSNKTVVFEAGVKVQAKSETFLDNTKPMFRALNIDNIELIGEGEGSDRATLKMNKSEYTSSEFGHILSFDGAKGFTVKGLKLTGAGGDGLHIAGATWQTAKPGARTYSENGLITDIIADNNRRQGLSIESGKNITVRDSTFSGTSGTAPSAGIDLEPTWDFERLENIKIENVILKDNNGNGLQLSLGNLDDQSAPVSIDVNNVTIENNNRSGLTLVLYNSDPNDPYRDQPDGSRPSSMANGNINIRNVDIAKSNGTFSPFNQPTAGIYIQSLSGSREDSRNLRANFQNVNISQTGNGTFATHPIYIFGFVGDSQPREIGNLSFQNVTVEDTLDRPVIKAELGRSDAFLSNISGNITARNPEGVKTDFDFQTPPSDFSLTVNGQSPKNGLSEIETESNSPTTGSLRGLNADVDDDCLYVGAWNQPESGSQGSRAKTSQLQPDQCHHLTIDLEGSKDVAANTLTGHPMVALLDASQVLSYGVILAVLVLAVSRRHSIS